MGIISIDSGERNADGRNGILNVQDELILVNWEAYVINYNGPLTDIVTKNNIVVPESLSLTDQPLQELEGYVNPLVDNGNSAIDHYLSTLRIIDNFDFSV